MIQKECIQQVLGSLMQHPHFLSEVDKYSFLLTDFPDKFEKYIFTAINGLYRNGATNIQPIDIENYLKIDQLAKTIFEQNNGIEYLQDIQELSEIENFPYYYKKLKKFNLLKDLKKSGFDISGFYEENLVKESAFEVNQNFEKLTTKDITDEIRKRILKIESKYEVNDEVESKTVLDGIEDLIDNIDNLEDIGLPLQGKIYSQVLSGARRGTLTIRSASSSVGKTRNAVGDACYLAFPIRYNWNTLQWEQEGSSEKVLFIVTEQQFEEIQKMILAYLTGINESRFRYGGFSKEEKVVITQAVSVIKTYKDNFILVKMPNPTIELVKTIVRENCLTYDIGYVFYDYIFIGPALLNEFKGFSLRNDEVLLMFATALKDLAVELDVAVFTSTQLNAKSDDNKNIRNEGSLAGGRSTINKADNGAIMARPTPEELDVLKNEYDEMPNLVTDIFKVRSGEWTQVRIWSYVDLGTLRKRDLFITNARLEIIPGFYIHDDIDVKNWDSLEEDEINQNIERLNNGEIL